jgi:hypothetical protein
MFKNIRQKRQITFFFLSILFSQPLILAAPTQVYDPKKVKEQQKKHLQLLKDYRTLKEPVEFADLPAFSGHTKFVIGYLEPNNNGVSTCEMQFLAQEDPQTVLSFYKDALSGNNWKILYAGTQSISARHGKGHMCNINVNESRVPKTKSRFVIDYRQIEPQR